MSKLNREKMYKTLIANDKAGRIPGISQDDGSLVAEFGKAPTKKELTAKELKAKAAAEKTIKEELKKNK